MSEGHKTDAWSVRELLPLASGVMLALSLPPFPTPYVAIVALIPLFVYLDGPLTAKRIVRAGVITSLTYFGINLNWLIVVGSFSWLIYPGYLAILLIYTCNFFIFILVVFLSKTFLGIDFVYTAPFAWVVSERLRASGDIAFPWSTIGYSFTTAPFFLQFADIVGVYGVSFVIVLLNVLLFRSVRKRHYAVAAAAVLIVVNAYNAFRWYSGVQADGHIPVAVIQPNVPQRLKWDGVYSMQIVRNLFAMQGRALQSGPALVVWPETAIPFYVDERRPFALTEMGALPPKNSYIVTGTLNVGYTPDGLAHFYNTASLFDPAGTMLGRYKKIYLVPGSELFPFRHVIGFARTFFSIQRVTYGAMEPGDEMTVFSMPGARFGMMICYESVYPQLARSLRLKGANFLVNVTNDAWFGRSFGPYQHASFLVMRAVENRIAIVRSANTGISGFVDPMGRWTARSGLFSQEILSANVPLTSTMTLYSRFGDVIVFVSCAVVALLAAKALITKYREE